MCPQPRCLQVSRWGKGLGDTTPATSGGSLNKVRQRSGATVIITLTEGHLQYSPSQYLHWCDVTTLSSVLFDLLENV